MTFSDQIKDADAWVAEAIEELTKASAAREEIRTHHVNELESDLDNAREDLELEKALTAKLKGLLDGGMVELVGELVDSLGLFVDNWSDDSGTSNPFHEDVNKAIAVLTKATEAKP